MERSVEQGGKGRKFRTYPKVFRATEKKKERGRGVSGPLLSFPSTHTHTTWETPARRVGGEALLRPRVFCSVLDLHHVERSSDCGRVFILTSVEVELERVSKRAEKSSASVESTVAKKVLIVRCVGCVLWSSGKGDSLRV